MPPALRFERWARDWHPAGEARTFTAEPAPTPNPFVVMGKLFFHMGVFAVVTLCVYVACLFLIKQEARREARKRVR